MLEYELPVGSEAFTPPSDPTEIEFEGRKWLVRWPDSRDLADAAACQDRGLARSILISRILPVDVDEASVPPILAALSAAHRSFWSMELHCCACPHSWNVVFDAGEFLWREVRAAARRILREVDVLSRVYHWSEDEILAMSEIRRSSYLEMVQ